MTTKRVAIVTGAGSGIGRAAARTLLDAGYRVALAGRRREALAGAAGDAEGTLVVPADISREQDVRALFERTRERFGRVDVVFNNAGSFGRPGPVDELSLADWQAVVDVNLTGVFLCAREAFRVMKEQKPRGGRIINNGSISAQVPRPLAAAYTTTKHGVTGLTKQLSLDGRRYGIACGQIDVGNAATEMTEAMAAGVPQADGSLAAEPRMDVADVARAVLYMADLPPEANVQFLTVMATTMPFIGRG